MENHMARRMAGGVIDIERQVADRDGVAIDQPAVGLERHTGDAVMAPVLVESRDPETVVLMRPLDRHAEFVGERLGPAAMVDMAMGEDDLLDRYTVLRRRRVESRQIAAGIDERA